ncbi:MAG TPA: hypothetical protein VKB15_03000, partial [Xanthobacteraceae bacterium]|nr:hypothetical protein [Xanthobacteraceae bacterium]
NGVQISETLFRRSLGRWSGLSLHEYMVLEIQIKRCEKVGSKHSIERSRRLRQRERRNKDMNARAWTGCQPKNSSARLLELRKPRAIPSRLRLKLTRGASAPIRSAAATVKIVRSAPVSISRFTGGRWPTI